MNSQQRQCKQVTQLFVVRLDSCRCRPREEGLAVWYVTSTGHHIQGLVILILEMW